MKSIEEPDSSCIKISSLGAQRQPSSRVAGWCVPVCHLHCWACRARSGGLLLPLVWQATIGGEGLTPACGNRPILGSCDSQAPQLVTTCFPKGQASSSNNNIISLTLSLSLSFDISDKAIERERERETSRTERGNSTLVQSLPRRIGREEAGRRFMTVRTPTAACSRCPRSLLKVRGEPKPMRGCHVHKWRQYSTPKWSCEKGERSQESPKR